MKHLFFYTLFLSMLYLSCSDDTDDGDTVLITDTEDTDTDPTSQDFTFENGLSFEWRLDELPDTYTTTADVVDIDAFDATPELVANLKAQGKKVVAYLSVGSVEDFREDASQFPAQVIGNVYEGFEDENWIDIREIDLIAPILRARFDMIQAKGFDAIEPDNINGYQNNTGFSLSQDDAIIFSNWLITEAHSRGLSIGQKKRGRYYTTNGD
jgi:hypothetical protein